MTYCLASCGFFSDCRPLRIGRFALRESLEQLHHLVLEDGEVNVEDAMVVGGSIVTLPLGPSMLTPVSSASITFSRSIVPAFFTPAAQAARLDSSTWSGRDRRIIGAVFPRKRLRKSLLTGLSRLRCSLSNDNAVALFGGKHQLVVGAAECGRCDWNFSGKAGGVELPVKRDRAAADQNGHDPIRLGRLDFRDCADRNW